MSIAFVNSERQRQADPEVAEKRRRRAEASRKRAIAAGHGWQLRAAQKALAASRAAHPSGNAS